jgi:hypothetical protein
MRLKAARGVPCKSGGARVIFVRFVHLSLSPPRLPMPRYYYGTVPALAWILNHYFYGGLHYSWLAGEFYPLRANPNSSNPYVIYGQLYAAWTWTDERDKFVAHLRNALQAGVGAYEERQTLDAALARRLRVILSRASVAFFYPVVYRVDMERIPAARRAIAGSGEEGSNEFLVRDLEEAEFELLFVDNLTDPDFVRFFLDARSHPARSSADAVLTTLERRVMP